MAAAGLYQASTYEEGLVWQRWQLFAPMPVLPLGAHIVCRIVGHAYLRVLATIYAAHVISAVGYLSGYFFDADSPAIKQFDVLGQRFMVYEANLSGPGQVSVVVSLLSFGFVIVLLAIGVRRGSVEARPLLVCFSVLGVAMSHDVLVLMGLSPSVYWLEHVGVLVIAYLGYRMMVALQKASRELKLLEVEHAKTKELAAVGELAAMIAHEVRNPLAAMFNALSAIKRRVPKDEQVDLLMEIQQDELERLSRIVTDLLRFARPVELKPRGTTIADLIQEAVVGATESVGEELDLPEFDMDFGNLGEREIVVDPDLMHQALVHVIENAIVASSDRGGVHIGVRNEAGTLRIDIEDHGEGMSEEARAKAFEPFFTTRPQGTGLGLPIVRRLVGAHGGSIGLESAADGGVNAIVLLPGVVT